MDADVLLRNWLRQAMPEKYQPVMEEKLGLVETSIGRMVPPPDPDQISDIQHPLAVRVEAYDYLLWTGQHLKIRSLIIRRLCRMNHFTIIWNGNSTFTIWHM